MMGSIIDNMRNPGDPRYYSQSWVNVVEDHLTYFQDDGNGQLYTPTGKELFQYKYRFFSFLRDIVGLNRPEHYYVILRANNMFSQREFTEATDKLIIPNTAKIDSLFQQYLGSLPG